MICDVCHNKVWTEVTSRDIVKALITAAKTLKIHKSRIDPNVIGAHLLQQGGEMAINHGI